MKRLLRMLRHPVRFARWWFARFVEELREFNAEETLEYRLGREEVDRLIVERAKATIAATNTPTREDCWECVDCGALQGEPTNFRCHTCKGQRLFSLSPLLLGAVRPAVKVSRFRTKVQR